MPGLAIPVSSARNMNAITIILFSTFVMASSLFGGLPEIEKLKHHETLSVSVTYSEPAITTYDYLFSPKHVLIKVKGKTLGKLALTEEEVKRIDVYLEMVRRGKKATRSHFGSPFYSIVYSQKGRKSRTWSFHIQETRKTKKPYLSLLELRQRLVKK